jgi:hypothetical protein
MYQGESEKMVDSFIKVLKKNPENGAAHYHLAVGLNALDRSQEAYQQLSVAIALGYSPDPKFLKEMEKKFSNNGDTVQILEVGPDNTTNNGDDSPQGGKEQSNA